MRALRPSTAGRLIVLTGSAGQRDAGKRPAMGEAVATHADLVYITDDDPHDEDPAAIRREVIAGALGHGTPASRSPTGRRPSPAAFGRPRTAIPFSLRDAVTKPCRKWPESPSNSTIAQKPGVRAERGQWMEMRA